MTNQAALLGHERESNDFFDKQVKARLLEIFRPYEVAGYIDVEKLTEDIAYGLEVVSGKVAITMDESNNPKERLEEGKMIVGVIDIENKNGRKKRIDFILTVVS